MATEIKLINSGEVTTNTEIVKPETAKTTLVKSMRFVNAGTASATLELKLEAAADGVARPIIPTLQLPANYSLIDDHEITLGKNDKIIGTASGAGAQVHFMVSGIQRDAL